MTINEQILAIIEKRQQRLPIVDNRMARWRDLDEALSDLETALAPTGRRSEKTIGAIDALSRIRESGIHDQIKAREQDLARVRNRFGRKTVNIGVSGQEKVGKSTLIRTISGLSNDEVPTSDERCTAVRSGIYHDPSSKAVVTIRTWESFREKILAPLYQVLWQKPPPPTLDQFEHDGLRDPIIRSSPDFDEKDADILNALKDLKDDQKAVWSYRDLLKAEQRTVTLKDIKDVKEYVAYPPPGVENPPRKYLAVSECELRHPFPTNEVAALGLIDLPGLGGPIKDADRHHLEGIQNDIDLAIMLKFAVEHSGMAPFNQVDTRVLNQLEYASRTVAIKKPGDFAFMLVNGSDPKRVDEMRKAIDSTVNVQGKTYTVLTVDVRDQTAVSALLRQLLVHLAERLGAMDSDLWQHTIDQDRKKAEELRSSMDAILAQVQSAGLPPSMGSLVIDLAEKIHGNLAIRLAQIENKYWPRKDEITDWQKRFKTELDKLSKSLDTEWTKHYFSPLWLEETEHDIAIQNGIVSAVWTPKMHACRAALREQFSQLDAVFRVEIHQMWNEIAAALRDTTGKLLRPDDSGEQTIRLFRERCENSGGCLGLVAACNAVMASNISLRLNFMQYVAEGMKHLDPHPPETKKQEKDRSKSAKQLAEELKDVLELRCEGAIEKTAAAIQEKARIVDEILYAVVEHANDLFIRWPGVRKEYQQLSRTWISEIDPMQYAEVDDNDLTNKRSREAIKGVRAALASLADQQ